MKVVGGEVLESLLVDRVGLRSRVDAKLIVVARIELVVTLDGDGSGG